MTTYDARTETQKYFEDYVKEQIVGYNTHLMIAQKARSLIHEHKQASSIVIYSKYLVFFATQYENELIITHAQGHLHQIKAFLTEHDFQTVSYLRHGKLKERSFPKTFSKL